MQTQRRKTQRNKKADVQKVPADIMKPRIIFLLIVFVLTLFGLVMVYSSSSVLALGSEQYGNNPNFFIKKQVISVGIAILICIAMQFYDYHRFGIHTAKTLALIFIFVLFATKFMGVKALGASRWIVIPGIGLQIQPSEFVKPYLVLVSAMLIKEIQETGSDPRYYIKDFLFCVGAPTALIVIQPDKGTTIVIILTILYMAASEGIISQRTTLIFLGGLFLLGFFIGMYSYFKGGYSGTRIKAFLNPWAYKDKEAYQIVQGYYAFASGGIFGKGVGFSSQKYAYLPMAYNDFIYAIIGEELGLVGTIGVLVAFFYFYKVSMQIADHASDLYGKMIVVGSSVMIVVQFLLNVVGVIGLFPSSGKPIPFISYGGSSIMGTYILVGMILNVSKRSKLPETRYDRRRSKLSVVEGGLSAQQHNSGFRVVEGAGEPTPRKRRGQRPARQSAPSTQAARSSRRGQQPQTRRSSGRNSSDGLRGRSSRPSRPSRGPRR